MMPLISSNVDCQACVDAECRHSEHHLGL